MLVPAPTEITPRAPAKVGVLLVNLGSPASPSVRDVRRYLRQFLSDRRVVDLPRWFWLPLLNLVILPIRARKSAHAYSIVWTKAGSPLVSISARQAAKLRARLGSGFDVELAMRYGEPSIEDGVHALRARGCEPVVLLSMFPQTSDATTGSVEAEFLRALAMPRPPASPRAPASQPTTLVLPPWFEDAHYIAALEESARAAVAQRPVSHWVFSFHGLPERYVRRGDPYRDHCESTARALAARMRLAKQDWSIAFQSRFGPEPWLQPYADVLVPALAAQHARVAIVMPGFTADCLETLEEIGVRLAASFRAAGGEALVVVPCVNDSDPLIEALAAQVEQGLRRHAPA
jgi:ferrochelatase